MYDPNEQELRRQNSENCLSLVSMIEHGADVSIPDA